MNRANLLILFLLISIITSCGIERKTKAELARKLNIFLDNSQLKSLDAVIILPGEGCSGCISSTEQFVKNLQQSDKIHVIFTAVRSKKILRLKLNLDLNEPFYHIDDESILNQDRSYTIYPTVVLLEDGQVRDYFYISPNSEDTLDSLIK